jgi:hypothetical protein
MVCVFSFVTQAPREHGFSFDLLSLIQDLFAPVEVDIGRRQIAQALVVTADVVVFDEVPSVVAARDARSF